MPATPPPPPSAALEAHSPRPAAPQVLHEDRVPRAVSADGGANFRLWNLSTGASPSDGAASSQALHVFAPGPWTALRPLHNIVVPQRPRYSREKPYGAVIAAGASRLAIFRRRLVGQVRSCTLLPRPHGPQRGPPHLTPPRRPQIDLSPTCAAYNQSSMSFVVAVGASLHVYSARTGHLARVFQDVAGDEIASVCFDHRERRIVVGTQSGQVGIYNSVNGRPMKVFPRHRQHFVLLRFLERSGILVTLSQDGVLHVLDDRAESEENPLMRGVRGTHMCADAPSPSPPPLPRGTTRMPGLTPRPLRPRAAQRCPHLRRRHVRASLVHRDRRVGRHCQRLGLCLRQPHLPRPRAPLRHHRSAHCRPLSRVCHRGLRRGHRNLRAPLAAAQQRGARHAGREAPGHGCPCPVPLPPAPIAPRCGVHAASLSGRGVPSLRPSSPPRPGGPTDPLFPVPVTCIRSRPSARAVAATARSATSLSKLTPSLDGADGPTDDTLRDVTELTHAVTLEEAEGADSGEPAGDEEGRSSEEDAAAPASQGAESRGRRDSLDSQPSETSVSDVSMDEGAREELSAAREELVSLLETDEDAAHTLLLLADDSGWVSKWSLREVRH